MTTAGVKVGLIPHLLEGGAPVDEIEGLAAATAALAKGDTAPLPSGAAGMRGGLLWKLVPASITARS